MSCSTGNGIDISIGKVSIQSVLGLRGCYSKYLKHVVLALGSSGNRIWKALEESTNETWKDQEKNVSGNFKEL